MPFGKKGNEQNPFDILRNLTDLKDIKKILGPDFFRNLPLSADEGRSDTAYESDSESFPMIDLYDSGSEIVLWADIPGLNRSEISLQASSYHVVIRGSVPSNIPRRDNRLMIAERFYGPFERDVELPARIRTDSVRASYTSGVLKVILTKHSPDEGEFSQSVPIHFE